MAKDFMLFQRLTTEIRMKIWKLAMPGGRIFEPGIKTTAKYPDVWDGGEWDDDCCLLEPPTLTLRKKFKPPSLRAVCRESRQASDEVGGFKFGLLGGIRHGCWFNHNSDVVALGYNMVKQVNVLYLDGVRILAFPHQAFRTEQLCQEVFDLIVSEARQCRVVEFHRQHFDGVAADNAKRYKVEDDDEIGCFRINKKMLQESISWGQFRDALSHAWDEYVAGKGYTHTPKPHFVGFDMV